VYWLFTGHEQIHAGLAMMPEVFQCFETRQHPPFDPQNPYRPDIYEVLTASAKTVGLTGKISIVLICDYCGNLRCFRLDLTIGHSAAGDIYRLSDLPQLRSSAHSTSHWLLIHQSNHDKVASSPIPPLLNPSFLRRSSGNI
jgi:hypothetical protein